MTRDEIIRKLVLGEMKDERTQEFLSTIHFPTEIIIMILEYSLSHRKIALEYERLVTISDEKQIGGNTKNNIQYLTDALKEHILMIDQYFPDGFLSSSKFPSYVCDLLNSNSTFLEVDFADSIFKTAIAYYHGMNAVTVDEDEAIRRASFAEHTLGMTGAIEFLRKEGYDYPNNNTDIDDEDVEDDENLIKKNKIPRNIYFILALYKIDPGRLFCYNDFELNDIIERLNNVDGSSKYVLIPSVRVQYRLSHKFAPYNAGFTDVNPYNTENIEKNVLKDAYIRLLLEVGRQGLLYAFKTFLDTIMAKDFVTSEMNHQLLMKYILRTFNSTYRKHVEHRYLPTVNNVNSVNSFSSSPIPMDVLLNFGSGPLMPLQTSEKEMFGTILYTFYKYLQDFSSTNSSSATFEMKELAGWFLEASTKLSNPGAIFTTFDNLIRDEHGNQTENCQKEALKYLTDLLENEEKKNSPNNKLKLDIMDKLYQVYRSPGIVNNKPVKMIDSKRALYWHGLKFELSNFLYAKERRQ
jgi:hypothetical protein